MLSRAYCLKKKKDFEEVFEKGEKAKGSFLYIKAIPGRYKNSRFGIVVPKKTARKAVDRNKIKRMARAAIKEELSKTKNIDCIIFFVSVPDDINSVRKDIEKTFKKLGIYD